MYSPMVILDGQFSAAFYLWFLEFNCCICVSLSTVQVVCTLQHDFEPLLDENISTILDTMLNWFNSKAIKCKYFHFCIFSILKEKSFLW